MSCVERERKRSERWWECVRRVKWKEGKVDPVTEEDMGAGRQQRRVLFTWRREGGRQI